ncbi:MAG: hypothetical protein M5U35_13320 [Roseovarius sp.]|nr:hypothetical protein [Roseovarius sp.]
MGNRENVYEREWDTISLTRTPLGLTARERFERFRMEAVSEMALRLTGGLMVAASTVLWLVLPEQSERGQFLSHGLLAAICSAVGLAVYAYGTRGFRRQLALDAKRGTLALTKINMNDRGRVMRTIGLDEIDSLFLRRPAAPLMQASLYVRVAGHHTPLLALTGDRADLEQIHRHLCDIVQDRGARPDFLAAAAHDGIASRSDRPARA